MHKQYNKDGIRKIIKKKNVKVYSGFFFQHPVISELVIRVTTETIDRNTE